LLWRFAVGVGAVLLRAASKMSRTASRGASRSPRVPWRGQSGRSRRARVRCAAQLSSGPIKN
jgi:hypothetical protein